MTDATTAGWRDYVEPHEASERRMPKLVTEPVGEVLANDEERRR